MNLYNATSAMPRRSATQLSLAALVLSSLVALLHSYPVASPQLTPSSNPRSERHRRKVAQLEIGSTPMEYMMQLRSNLSDERGRPKNYTQDPTSVWCFMDKGNNYCELRTLVLQIVFTPNLFMFAQLCKQWCLLNKRRVMQSIV